MRVEVAVVIPAYNAVGSLEKSVRSIMRQTLKKIAIWIVDDGSTDGTGDLADKLSAEDARITVIHQPNRGCYMARLAALRMIDAEYFGFVDADDEIMPEMYYTMVNVARANNLDAVRCSIVGESNDDGSLQLFDGREVVHNKLIVPWREEGNGSANVWNWLYKNNYDFDRFHEYQATMFEDLAFNLQFFKSISRCAFLEGAFYKYFEVVGSAVHSFTDRHIHDFREIIKLRDELIEDKACNATWVVKNVRGMLISAASARSSIFVASTNVRKLLSLPEVRKSLAFAKKDKLHAFFVLASIFPPSVFVLMIRCVLWMRNLCK